MHSFNKKLLVSMTCLTMIAPLSSCGNKLMGKIIFDLNGGSFPADFNTMELVGPAGAKVEVDIPDPTKEGYEFVGWREKKEDGSYRIVSKQFDETDGKYYFHYPYVEDTLYAYYEKLVTLSFDLTEAASQNGILVEPEKNPESFKGQNLHGYVNKPISTDALPTAKADGSHLTFEYWYTEYPLKAVQNENKETYYQLDVTQEKGVYKFDNTAFSEGNMVFPRPLDQESFTLYAHWKKDPKITIHYNLDGVSDQSFQTKEVDFSQNLIAQIKRDLGIDFGAEATGYRYYPVETKEHRFAGFYTDPAFKNPISLNSSIMDNDMDIYLKWDDHINVVLDYAGGMVNGLTSETFSDYYEGDILGTEFYDAHLPVKDSGDFLYFVDEKGGVFNFIHPLPDTDLLLTAVYDDYPILSLNYDYPDNFEGTRLENKSFVVKPGESIVSYLTDFEKVLELVQDTNNHLDATYFYSLDTQGKEIVNINTDMPMENFTLNLKIFYQWSFKVKTFANLSADGNYTEVPDLTYSQYFNMKDIVDYDSLGVDFMGEQTLDGATYLYNGLYLDEASKVPVTDKDFDTLGLAQLPLAVVNDNQESVVEKKFIRRLTKAITLTFKETGQEDKMMKIVPGSKLARYESAIQELLGNYTRLYVVEEGVQKNIVTILPKEDMVVYVER